MNDERNLNLEEQKSQKRVLFLITQSELGGAQRFLFNLVTNMDRDRYEVLVAVGNDGNGILTKMLREKGVTVYTLSHLKRAISPLNELRAIHEIRHLIRGFIPDTLFCLSSKAGALGSIASKKFPMTKVVYRIGGWQFNDPIPTPLKWAYILIEKLTAKYKDIIILNNKFDLDCAEKYKIKPRKSIRLIYNGIDLKNLDFFEKEEAKEELFSKLTDPQLVKESKEARFVIGTIANFYKTKGLKYFVEAIEMLPPGLSVIAYIIGDGLEEEKNEIQNLIKEKGLSHKIICTGKIENAHKYLPAFDIFVLPSVKEGFPWTILEAMAAKLPIVSTSVGAVPEIIENEKNGMIVPIRDPQAMARAIIKIASNDKFKLDLGINAHQTALFRFDQYKMIKEIERLL